MMYALARHDGGVEIMQCFPVRAKNGAGDVFSVDRIFWSEGRVILSNENQTVTLTGVPEDFAVTGWEFEYADPRTEVAKWSKDRHLEISSIDRVTEVPTERTYRDGWTFQDGKVGHDMAKCRKIHRDRLRSVRAVALSALDVEYHRADEAGDASAKAAVAKRKQALRDVTADPRIEAAQTPADLMLIGLPV